MSYDDLIKELRGQPDKFTKPKTSVKILTREKFTERSPGIFQKGFTRQEINEFLKSNNPYRKNIEFSEEDLFFLELITKLGMDMSQVHAYNEMIEHVKNFLQENIADKSKGEYIDVRVKITRNGVTNYELKSYIFPNELIKNKTIKQHISFVKVSGTVITEIKTIPMMIGCKWCATFGKTPIELHNAGENGADHKGYFIMESQKSTEAKYFVAHEKVCHNCIITIIDDRKGYMTTLKSQDSQNNSMEINVFKKDDVYYLGSIDFRIDIPTNQIFNQIYEQMKKITKSDQDLIIADSYAEFMNGIIGISIDKEIREFFMYDFLEGSTVKLAPSSEIEDIETALEYLFKNVERKNLFAVKTSEHSTIDKYPSMIIDTIFSSVYIPKILTDEKEEKQELKIEFNILQAKAMLLIRMILLNNLVEQGIMKKTDRDDLSYKCFMNAAEVMKRDLTRDGGAIFADDKPKDYKPSPTESKGETNVFEALMFSNHLDTKSMISKSSTPRSSHSRNLSVRSVRPSQNGYKCLFQTPSGGNIGLVHHFAITSFFSFSKNTIHMLEYIMKFLIEEKDYRATNLFSKEKFNNNSTEYTIIKLLEKNNVDLNSIISHRNQDFEIMKKRNLLIKKHIIFFENNRANISLLIKFFNFTKNSDVDKNDVSKILESAKNLPLDKNFIREKITNSLWLEFLLIKDEFLSEDVPVETIVLDMDNDLNKRLKIWKYISSEKIDPDIFEKISKSKKRLISLNSIPFALIDQNTYEDLRKHLKRDYRFMDVAVVEEKYEITYGSAKNLYTSSYNIYCDGGRVCRPLYNVEVLKQKKLLTDEAINEYFKNNHVLEKIISDGVIEMVLPIELQYESILEFRHQITSETKKKFCEIDPNALFGLVSACAPMLNHSPGNRIIHETAMSIAALTGISTNFRKMSETSAKLLHCPEAPVVITKTSAYYNNLLRNGVNIFLGIKIDDGNVEDSFLLNERVAKSITDAKISTYEIIIDSTEIMGMSSKGNYKIKKYHAIDPNTGFPCIGAHLDVGDVIFAKYKEEIIEQTDDEGNKYIVEQIVNKSEFVEEGKEGEVQDISQVNNDKVTIFRITISKTRTVGVGRKLAFDGNSQKGIVGKELPHDQMPYITTGKNKGMRLGAVFSPMSMSSRGTPGVSHSALFGTHAVVTGKQNNLTSFTVSNERLVKINEELENLGFSSWGYETFYDPVSGTEYQLACGFAYIKILKHTADDKQKARGHLDYNIDKSSKQPSKGGPTGALRVGYMDTGTFASHNTMSLIRSFLADQSDLITVPICKNCGHICDRYNDDPKTIVDNYASKHCTKCRESDTVVKVNLPYAVVRIHNQSLTIGKKLNLFPKLLK